MEGQLFDALYSLCEPLGKLRPGKAGQVHSDFRILMVLLWGCLHDRPVRWACRLENWGGACPWLMLPSAATISRRRRTLGVQLLLSQLLATLNDAVKSSLFKHIDARPLPVGGASKDPDALRGYGAGQLCKGYKLHEIRSGEGHRDGWTLSAMRDREPAVAPRLIDQLPDGSGGYITGDNAYDSNALYDQAAAKGYQWVAPPREQAQGLGHQRHSIHRLRALDLLANPLPCCREFHRFGQALLTQRRQIERDFARESSCGGGLAPLPPWVRRPRRVALWVACKFAITMTRAKIQELHAA
jgi:hypothetical protein